MSKTPVLLAEIAECIVSQTTSYTLNNTKITNGKSKKEKSFFSLVFFKDQKHQLNLPSCCTKITTISNSLSRVQQSTIFRMILLTIRWDLFLTTTI